jgi:hypothetical protein
MRGLLRLPNRNGALPLRVVLLISGVAFGALAVLAGSGPGTGTALAQHTGLVATLLVLTVALEVLSLRGSATAHSVAGIGMLAAAFSVGLGVGAFAGILAALVHAAKVRPKAYKIAFNAGGFVLATAAATGVYRSLDGPSSHGFEQLLGAEAAACAFLVVNVGLLTLAIAGAERRHPVAVWKERLAWLTPHYLCFGPLALAAVLSRDELGVLGLLPGALFPVLLAVLLWQSLKRLRVRRFRPLTTA